MVKRQFGYVKVRYRGLKKNTAQLTTLFALSNLWMVRRTLLGARAGVPPIHAQTASGGLKTAAAQPFTSPSSAEMTLAMPLDVKHSLHASAKVRYSACP